jgi:ATP-binding cassette subfamily F protein uup
VVTSTLVLEGEGRVGEYVGGYSDWLRQRPAPPAQAAAPEARGNDAPAPRRQASGGRAAKLSYKDQRELERLPQVIEDLEAAHMALAERLADPDFYRREASDVGAARAELARLEAELAGAYARWEALEARDAGGA